MDGIIYPVALRSFFPDGRKGKCDILIWGKTQEVVQETIISNVRHAVSCVKVCVCVCIYIVLLFRLLLMILLWHACICL